MSVEQQKRDVQLAVEQIGGIENTSVTFSPGVTLLVGRNATNRTSLLQAVMAALGSNDVSVKGDANEATVEMNVGEDTYHRSLKRTNDHITASGEPYLEDSTLADLFAFLLESNKARRAVANSDDLREIIMRPVDTDEIQAEIERLVQRRHEVDQELDEIESLKQQLPSLEEERTSLRDRIEDIQAELADKEAELDSRDADLEQTREEKAELEEKLSTLRDNRSTLETIRYDLETERDSLDSLQSEMQELETELAELPETPVGEIDELESRIDRLRAQKRQLQSEISECRSVIQFNEDMIGETDTELSAALGSDGPVTDELLPEETTTCWTCGTEVDVEQIEATVDRLREYSQQKSQESNEIQDELDTLKEERRELQQQQSRREDVQQRLTELDREIEATEDEIEQLTDRKETIRTEISEVESEVEALENDSYEEILDLHKEANQLEYDLGKVEGNLEGVEAEIQEIEARIDEEDELTEKREALTDDISEQRTKIDRIEQQAVDEFNEHMDTVLNLLGYDNLDRIWIERVEREVREGRRKVTRSVFDLHVIRQTENNTTYEDTINHLSESEREVTGLIFALAGYLAHEVYETVPVMILDSLEAIDSERIAELVEYLSDYSDYLVVALLPEDAVSLDDEYQRISEI
ncbi:chromosome segregation protein SMC [Natrinema sp. CBA1119]|uniref:archaea-specific SMC-related protein n=1 Tax=Natrinema sp. CBA1119 TaxID=1608465 RepID=UPI000BFA7432|nr:archaea-specific SMC-related protein [Natrinema sp. CBA1119]PGF14278.1 chromosome segregation protein SMC [Natrinema sp. CBA1119]